MATDNPTTLTHHLDQLRAAINSFQQQCVPQSNDCDCDFCQLITQADISAIGMLHQIESAIAALGTKVQP